MTISLSLATEGSRAVVVKRATAGSASSLRREGERLRRAAHPGVVPVVRSGPAGDGWELVVAHAGRSLASVDRLTVARSAAVGAALASTVADLHDLGVVHGRIDASHVLIGDHGRPLLCGFGDGTEPADPSHDVGMIGALLASLLGSEHDGEPIPERRWRRSPWTGWERRALLGLADQALAEPSTLRPTARRLAAAISEAVPHERTSDSDEVDELTDDPIDRLRPVDVVVVSNARRRWAGRLAGVVGLLLLGAGALRLIPSGSTTSAPLTESVGQGEGVEGPSFRIGEPVEGSVLVAQGRRYRVGEPGDHLLVDDWRCDGHPTAAVLRPRTGEVFVFPTWSLDRPLQVSAVATISGSETLVSERADGSCPRLGVRTADGDLVPIDVDEA